MSNPNKQSIHWWVITGQVMFRKDKDSDAQVQVLNGLINAEQNKFTQPMLEASQRRLQMHLHERTTPIVMEILDVCILQISYLGQMTRDEFMGDNKAEVVVAAPPTQVQ